MGEIKLEPKMLLGFKIIARGESAATLHSPKIGHKNCQTTDTAAATMNNTPTSAKIGSKE